MNTNEGDVPFCISIMIKSDPVTRVLPLWAIKCHGRFESLPEKKLTVKLRIIDECLFASVHLHEMAILY